MSDPRPHSICTTRDADQWAHHLMGLFDGAQIHTHQRLQVGTSYFELRQRRVFTHGK